MKRLHYSKLGESKLSVVKIFQRATIVGKIEVIINIFLIGVGIYILGPGLYATVQSIILSYQADAYGSVFSCVSNAI